MCLVSERYSVCSSFPKHHKCRKGCLARSALSHFSVLALIYDGCSCLPCALFIADGLWERDQHTHTHTGYLYCTAHRKCVTSAKCWWWPFTIAVTLVGDPFNHKYSGTQPSLDVTAQPLEIRARAGNQKLRGGGVTPGFLFPQSHSHQGGYCMCFFSSNSTWCWF